MQRLEVSGAVRPLYWSLGVKGLRIKPKNTFDWGRKHSSLNFASHTLRVLICEANCRL